MLQALDVAGLLSILANGRPLHVEFRGDVVAVVLPDASAALALRRMIPRSGGDAGVRAIQEALARSGLTLEVWIGSSRVARLSGDSRPGRIGSWLGLGPVEIALRPLIASLARRRRIGDNG